MPKAHLPKGKRKRSGVRKTAVGSLLKRFDRRTMIAIVILLSLIPAMHALLFVNQEFARFIAEIQTPWTQASPRAAAAEPISLAELLRNIVELLKAWLQELTGARSVPQQGGQAFVPTLPIQQKGFYIL